MVPLLLTLSASVWPADRLPPALVPAVAVAGAAVVLGTDAVADRPPGRMALFDREGPLADRLSASHLDDARRWMSVARAFPKPRKADPQRARSDAELAKLLEDTRRRLDESRRRREEMQRELDEYRERSERFRSGIDPFRPWGPPWPPLASRPDNYQSLSLIVPASHVHPAIRRDLGWSERLDRLPPAVR